MLRGLPHLAKYMPDIKDARRLIPDPESELDFESISRVIPLPDSQAPALELAHTFQDTGIMSGTNSGFQQQFQVATNNNWASIPSMFPTASALEASQVRDIMRGNNDVAAALQLEAELGAQDQQNVALLIELAARRQHQIDVDSTEQQQANPGNAALAALLESMCNNPSHFGYQ